MFPCSIRGDGPGIELVKCVITKGKWGQWIERMKQVEKIQPIKPLTFPVQLFANMCQTPP